MIEVDEYSLTAVPLTQYCDGKAVGHATGFFYRKGDQLYLVSNWHVFSGRNTYTGQSSHGSGFAIPDAISLLVHRREYPKYEIHTLPLFDGDHATWIQHQRDRTLT